MIGQEITARHMTAALPGATVMVWMPVSGALLRLPVTNALAAFDAFIETWGVKYDKAARLPAAGEAY
jgi:hypothetical protein